MTIGTGIIIILWLLRLLQTGNTARWNRPRRPRPPRTHGQTTRTRTVPKIRNHLSQILSHRRAQTPPRRSPNKQHMGSRRSSSRLWRNQHHGHPHQTQPPFIPASTPFSNRTPASQSPNSSPTLIQTWPSHTSTCSCNKHTPFSSSRLLLHSSLTYEMPPGTQNSSPSTSSSTPS